MEVRVSEGRDGRERRGAREDSPEAAEQRVATIGIRSIGVDVPNIAPRRP